MDATRDPRFVELVRTRSTALLRTAYLLTGDRQLAEDLVQTALAKTALHWRRIELNRAEAYTRRVIYHEQVSRWRRRRVHETLIESVPDTAAHGSTDEQTDLRIVLQQALASLGRGQRAVLILRYYEDLSEREVAEVLGCSIGTVKSQAHRALAALRTRAPELLDFSASDKGVTR